MPSHDLTIGLRIEEICTRFEKAWQAGLPPKIEEYTEGWTGDERLALLRELVLLDREYQRKAGRPVSLGAYRQRFRDLTFAEKPRSYGGSQARTVTLASAPRLAGDGSQQSTVGEVRPTPGPLSPTEIPLLPPGYVYLDELGRGGMGVVYRVRHVRLGRTSALKMILAGTQAGDAHRQRFETEAQAVARLQHENIVRVFEIGEHSGLPYMDLEFCSGGPLNKHLRVLPPTPHRAAEMVRTLALGMQAAHDVHVIHRDLKPANVLIAADGTLKITDFGLAKKLDEVGKTHDGMIMGTPSYMPPEQARGDADLGPCVDIYSLGAILYEALTGRPPFRGATAVDTIYQVLHHDLVPVRQLSPSCPRDLETICHKCLQKDAKNRYSTAKELADDLQRFLERRPIIARPVGILERGYRWIDRNRVVSALAASVFLVLSAGLVVSNFYARKANNEATRANAETVKANNRAEALERENDEHRTSRAASLIRPLAAHLQEEPVLRLPPGQPLGGVQIGGGNQLVPGQNLGGGFNLGGGGGVNLGGGLGALGGGFNLGGGGGVNLGGGGLGALGGGLGALGGGFNFGGGFNPLMNPILPNPPELKPELLSAHVPLRDAEILALDELAGTTDEKLRLRFVEVALRSPVTLRQLRVRADEAMHASLGLDLRRSEAAERLILERWDSNPTDAEKLNLALIVSRLNIGPTASLRAGNQFVEQLTFSNDEEGMKRLLRGLLTVSARVESRDATRLLLQAARSISSLCESGQLAQALAARLDPTEAEATALDLIRDLGRTRNTYTQIALADCLVAVAGHLEPRAAIGMLGPVLEKFSLMGAGITLTRGFHSSAMRLKPKEACVVLFRTAMRLANSNPPLDFQWIPTRNNHAALRLVWGIEKFTPKLTSGEADEIANLLLDRLVEDAKKIVPLDVVGTLENSDPPLLSALAELAPRLESAQAARVLSRYRDFKKLQVVTTVMGDSRCFQVLSERLDGKEAVALLTDCLSRSSNPVLDILELEACLPAAAPHLPRKMAAELAPLLLQAYRSHPQQQIRQGHLHTTSKGLSALLAALDPANVTEILLQALSGYSNAETLAILQAELKNVSVRMEPMAAKALLDRAREKHTGANRVTGLSLDLAEATAALALRLEPLEGVNMLLDELDRVGQLHQGKFLAQGIAGLAPKLAARDASIVSDRLLAAMSRKLPESVLHLQEDRPGYLRALAEALTAVAGRLAPPDAAVICERATKLLLDDSKKQVSYLPYLTRRPHNDDLTRGLAALATRMEPRQAIDLLDLLLKDLDTAAITTGYALTGFSSSSDSPLDALVQCISHIARRLDREAAEAVTDRLIQAMATARYDNSLWGLAQGLSVVMPRLTPERTNAAASQATARLLRVLGQPRTNDQQVQHLVDSLMVMTAYLDPAERSAKRAKAADLLVQAMTTANDASMIHELAGGLGLLLAGQEGEDIVTKYSQGANLVLFATSKLNKPEGPGQPGGLGHSTQQSLGYFKRHSAYDALRMICRRESGAAQVPAPAPLPASVLVELLKHPLCVRETRRVVLDTLSIHYGRPFDDHWDFARYAEEKQLGFDLTSPARTKP